MYVYWEPADGDEFQEVRRHCAEVAELLERVGSASHGSTLWPTTSSWNQWDTVEGVAWLPVHLTALRGRYRMALATG